ncbi:hypothetical protein P153DRAFT_302168 [Dothidotthia symphoricarpi CBS 119687]|uniref:Uncharacterized protein n=1 Tax=Dothidotthia symphoricarpi CBS 119687 TaxID=1392245 RepID=A0A6A5ZXG0_9PLEO|nr:uncharacterized protein P153DRAFT_302168 [Dothidotthia symphoricarpi CBS 119687]KAF2124452.1 hypothetical protein P153DRAFT_302168 [Dothidotthia symphoricarpi CBS 119687]
MSLVLGLFLGGCVTAIPIVTGVAEGVEYQKKQNAEAASETRMIKFNLNTACDVQDDIAKEEVDNGTLVLRHDKVWIVPRDQDGKPLPPDDQVKMDPPLHAFAGFYIQYPDEDRSPPQRGLVSTISDDPPMLNWLYCDRATYELRYGNRTTSITHIVGEWDWTEDESNLILDGWEGFVAIDEWDGADTDPTTPWGREGLRWALYFDKDDNGLKGKHKGRDMFEVMLQRKMQSEEDQLKMMEAAEKKMQVKSRGGLSTQFSAPAKERDEAWVKKYGRHTENEKKKAFDVDASALPWEGGEES